MYLIKSCPFQTDHMQVRTRFAPSPTGFMHLGNIWIALLNWLWTRQNKGKIVLRIEDIDTQRSKPSYIQGILDDLSCWDWILMRALAIASLMEIRYRASVHISTRKPAGPSEAGGVVPLLLLPCKASRNQFSTAC